MSRPNRPSYFGKRNKFVNPPTDNLQGPWIFHTQEMLQSPAFQARSITARRIWDALLVEHLNNGSYMNGELVMPYNELQRLYGCSRSLIRDGIDELVALGFIAEMEPREINGNHRPANTYRLTFLGTGKAAPPTNEWRRFTGAPELVEMAKRNAKEKRKAVRSAQAVQRKKVRPNRPTFSSHADSKAELDPKVVKLKSSKRHGGSDPL
jgi:hypothetical protein